MSIKKGFHYFEPICADLASKFAKSANKTRQFFFKNQTVYQKTQNFMLISKLLKKLQKIDAKEVIDKNVMEKCTFFTFTHMFIKLVSI